MQIATELDTLTDGDDRHNACRIPANDITPQFYVDFNEVCPNCSDDTVVIDSDNLYFKANRPSITHDLDTGNPTTWTIN